MKSRVIAWEDFGRLVTRKVEMSGKTYRGYAKEMKLDYASLFRVSAGGSCGADIYLKLCVSLNIDPLKFYTDEKKT